MKGIRIGPNQAIGVVAPAPISEVRVIGPRVSNNLYAVTCHRHVSPLLSIASIIRNILWARPIDTNRQ